MGGGKSRESIRNGMTEIEVKYASRYVKRKRSVAIGKSLLKTLTEPITNSDDSYRVQTEKSGSDEVCPITIFVDRPARTVKIVDQAEGMSLADLKNKFKEYGAAKSGAYSGYSTRGLFGQGVSDVLLYHGKGAIKSIKDGEASVCLFYEKRGRAYISVDPEKGDVNKTAKRWGINPQHGTVVEFVVESDTVIHEYENLIKRLSSFYMLRLINSNDKRLVKLIYTDTRGTKESHITYRFPDGEPIDRKSFPFEFENYSPVTVEIELYKSSVPLRTIGDDRENGLLVFDEKNAVYDLTFFDLDHLPGADRFFGLMKLVGARDIILDKINHKRRPEEILTDSRDGFNKQHEFYKELSLKIKDWLYPFLIEGKSKRNDEGVSETARENHKKVFDELNKLYEELTGEDTNGTIKKPTTKQRPVGGIEFARPNITITAGKRYGLQLAIDTRVIKKGSQVILSNKNSEVGFSPVSFTVEDPLEKNDGVAFKTIVLTGQKNKSVDKLQAKSGNHSASVVVSVVSEEIFYPDSGLGFSPDYFRAIVNRDSTLHLYVDLSIIKSNSKVTLTSSNKNIVLLEHQVRVPKRMRTVAKVARIDVPFRGKVTNQSGFIQALCGEYSAQCTVDVKDRLPPPPPKGLSGKFNGWDFDDTVPLDRQTTYDPAPNSPNQGYILINSKHPINEYYFGENPQKSEVEKSHKAQLYLAELLLNESLQQMIPEAWRKGVLPQRYGPEYDILTYIAAKKSECGPSIYKHLVEEKGVIEVRKEKQLEGAKHAALSDTDLVSGLEDREREMVEMRFGLNQQRPHTLEEIASKFDITRERVRQIVNAAIAKKYGHYDYLTENSRDYIDEQEKRIDETVQKVIEKTCEFYGLTPQEIKKRTRKMNVAKPRQVAMYLLRDLVHLSFPSIGRLFGLDHTTVLYSFEKITDGLVSDEKLNKQVLSIKSQLK